MLHRLWHRHAITLTYSGAVLAAAVTAALLQGRPL